MTLDDTADQNYMLKLEERILLTLYTAAIALGVLSNQGLINNYAGAESFSNVWKKWNFEAMCAQMF